VNIVVGFADISSLWLVLVAWVARFSAMPIAAAPSRSPGGVSGKGLAPYADQ
jgi:hypothetical protein